MSRFLPVLLPLALMACDYTPPLRPGKAEEVLNIIHGSVVLSGPEDPSTVLIVVFNADNPGPPDGTGLPPTFATVHADDFNQVEGGWAASYTVSGVDDGTWIVTGLMDVDGDFSPFPSGLAGATCGDWGGQHFSDFASSTPGRVTVKGGEYIDNVTVIIDTVFDTERPAYKVRNGFPPMDLELGTIETNVQEYYLDGVGVHTNYEGQVRDPEGKYPLDLDGPCVRIDDDANLNNFCDPASVGCETAFWILAVDADGDGLLDSHPDHDPALGVKDIWPRVYLTYLGTPELDGSGAPVLDKDGNPSIEPPDLPEGEFWGSENFVFGLEARLNAVPVDLNVPTPASSLKVAWAPAIAHFYPEWNDLCVGEPPNDPNVPCQAATIDIRNPEVDASAIPKGLWEINVISFTGQTWTVPNEIALDSLPGRDGFVSGSQQGAVLTK